MIVTFDQIKGSIIKDNDTYVLEDNTFLNNMVLSKTVLHRDQETGGHSHDGVEEMYFFMSGTGEIQIGENKSPVTSGSVALIPDGDFHKVFNTGDQDLVFISIFETYER
ncbi:MAG: cupin domain-containing protein [Neptunomonas phycophila]|uniref:cupin domain-containing protein n=1 Tax=Neptunomonas phycophila TaxID=1572645 RepID=UPI003B8C3353